MLEASVERLKHLAVRGRNNTCSQPLQILRLPFEASRMTKTLYNLYIMLEGEKKNASDHFDSGKVQQR